MCALMLQIVQTRILSVIVYYHLAFFAISMAMLGMTIGSLLVYFRQDLFSRERVFENLAWISAALSICIALTTLSLITTIVGSGVSGTLIMTAVIWLKLVLILVPPYILAGMSIALALTRSPLPAGIVYGVDLLGAASGCLVTLVLLSLADAISVMFAIAALAAIGAVAFSVARRNFAQTNTAPLLALSWLGKGWRPAILAAAFSSVALGNAMLQPSAPGRFYDGLTVLLAKNQLYFLPHAVSRWNSYSRVIVGPAEVQRPLLWGPSPLAPAAETISQRFMDIDGSAATWMYQFDGDLAKLDFLKYDITNLAYAIRHEGRSAVIGVGGGRDLLSAYLFGFRDVTGVELNPIFIDLLTRDFRDYNRLTSLPGVHLFVDEARSWFARTDQRFDLIEMSLIDTWAATGAGAYSLSENGLYTTQGWQHFLKALTPSGVFTVSRWFNPKDVTETGRLVSLAAQAVRDLGIAQPEQHLFVATADSLATLVVAKSPFTPEELSKLRQRTESLQFEVLYSPDKPDPDQIVTQIIKATTPEELALLSSRAHLDLSITTDDRPFFFNQLNLFDLASLGFAFSNDEGIVRGNLMATMTLMLIVVLSGILVLFTMIFPALPSVRQTDASLARLGTFYFLLIGFGFMCVEIGLIQRLSAFLGHPVYGLAIGLFGIILSTGIGSLMSERFPLASNRKLLLWLGMLALYLIVLPFWFPQLVAAFQGGSLIVRALVSLAAIIPSGLLMGFGFPTGMRLVGAIDARPTPWFWAVNGAAGVLGASVAVVIGINFSINVSFWIGAACYLLLFPIAFQLLALSGTSNAKWKPVAGGAELGH
jgi:predicted membrane-bound spermidine synthase